MIPDPRIGELVNEFVANITALARETAVATLSAAFSSSRGQQGTPRRSPASSKPSPSESSPASSPARASSPSRRKGAKRAAAEVERLKTLLAKHVEAHPGQRVEQINKVLGTKTHDVRLPLAKLIEAGDVKTKGSRRATQYFPA